jgi:hypothetical protein
MRFVGVMVLLALLLSGSAWAHSWYANECCNDRDCFRAERIRFEPNGDRIVTTERGVVVVVPANFIAVRPSHDLSYHVCYKFPGLSQPAQPICFYVPGMS